LEVLQRIRQPRSGPQPEPLRAGERCELCAEPISEDHGHLVDVQARNLMCACRGCYLLFMSDGAGGAHFRAVQIPVGIAFFFLNSTLGRVAAFYPGPAGATESELPLDTWEEVVAANSDLATLQPDVEAFLVRSDTNRGGSTEGFLVPIDACYELVGHLRRLWRGFDGGREAHDEMDAFFARVRSKAR